MNTRRVGKTRVRVSEVGLGTATFGGVYAPVSQEEATEAVEAALKLGVTYIDTAPLYGYGLAELYLGEALAGVRRDRFVVSTKVGRVLDPIAAEEQARRKEKEAFFLSTAPFKVRDDYTREGILRTFHSSLERLQLERVEIAYIHYGDITDANTRRIVEEAYPAVADLRRQGLVDCIGMGMDHAAPLARFAREAEFDIFMVAGRYTLLDTTALDELFPLCEKKGISVALAAPYSSGILASNDLSKEAKYWYKDAPPEVLERARAIKAVCDAHGVPMKAAALQFGLGHPVVAATAPGARNGAEAAENVRMAEARIPRALWAELAAEGLIPAGAPIPR